MENLCSDCPKRQTCAKLCKEAKKYVNQDYIRPDRATWKSIQSNEYNEIEENELGMNELKDYVISKTYLTKTEKKILTLLDDKLTRADICQLLGITRNNLRSHIYNLRKKIDDFCL